MFYSHLVRVEEVICSFEMEFVKQDDIWYQQRQKIGCLDDTYEKCEPRVKCLREFFKKKPKISKNNNKRPNRSNIDPLLI